MSTAMSASSRTTSSGARRTCSECLRAIGSNSSVVSRAGNPPSSQTARISRTRQADALRSNRSEEHTSELQSHVNLVCRLLLEKKKKTVKKKKEYIKKQKTIHH